MADNNSNIEFIDSEFFEYDVVADGFEGTFSFAVSRDNPDFCNVDVEYDIKDETHGVASATVDVTSRKFDWVEEPKELHDYVTKAFKVPEIIVAIPADYSKIFKEAIDTFLGDLNPNDIAIKQEPEKKHNKNFSDFDER